MTNNSFLKAGAWALRSAWQHPTPERYPGCLISPEAYECLHTSLQGGEFWQPIEGNAPGLVSFPDQVEAVIRAVPEKMRGPIKMPYPIGVEAHQTRTGEVCGHGIVGKNDFPKMPMSSVQRPVSLHGNDAVGDR